MNVRVASAMSWLVLLAACGDGAPDARNSAAGNFVPPATQAPTPIAGQEHSEPLTAYVGHYPNDAVGGVTFFDRTEVANTLIDIEPDARFRRRIVARDVTAVPIFAQGARIAAHGCEPNNCGGRNWTLLIAADGNRDDAALCVHDAATMGETSRWSTRSGTTSRPGGCPSA